MRRLIIVAVTHTSSSDAYITLWRPDNNGYTPVISRAGRYAHEHVARALGYYNTGDHLAVPADVIESMSVEPPAGWFDYPGGCVMNIRSNWFAIKNAAVWPTQWPVKTRPATKATLAQLAERFDRVRLAAIAQAAISADGSDV